MIARASDEDLARYGFTPGNSTPGAWGGGTWCASCGRTHKDVDPGAFKCRPCAIRQYREVERTLASIELPSNFEEEAA